MLPSQHTHCFVFTHTQTNTHTNIHTTQLSEADAADAAERLEDFLSICAPPDSNDEFKVSVIRYFDVSLM